MCNRIFNQSDLYDLSNILSMYKAHLECLLKKFSDDEFIQSSLMIDLNTTLKLINKVDMRRGDLLNGKSTNNVTY